MDIADFLVRLSGLCLLLSQNQNSFSRSASSLPRPIPNILHYSGEEPFTKYEMCLIFAKLLGLPHKHIIPDAELPTGAAVTTRPRDCHLDCQETEALGVDGGMGLSLFEDWWAGMFLKDTQ